jgi:hypothetical protein
MRANLVALVPKLRSLAALVAMMTALWPAAASAVLVVPMTFEQLVSEAAAVVYARVADVRGQWTSDRQSIASIVQLEPLQYFKGHLGESITMRLPGGAAGGRMQVIPGAPVLKPGELVVVFLKARGPALLTTLGLGQGLFRVTRDARNGGLLVLPPPLKESAAGRVIRGAATRRALTLDAFAAAVRDAGAR